MSNVFFTGCTHFGHENIIRLAKRPFKTVEEMDEALIENWNKVVKAGDIVHHLGDYSWGRDKKMMSRMNGTTYLYQGNHDMQGWGAPYAEMKGWGRGLVLFHYPIEEWNGYFKGTLHLHCHTHAKDFVSAPRRFNVGVDANKYTPVHVDTILSHPNAIFEGRE